MLLLDSIFCRHFIFHATLVIHGMVGYSSVLGRKNLGVQ